MGKCLCDTTDPDYKNKVTKESAWSAVAHTVNTAKGKSYTAVDYKDKVWKNLRDHYVRALNGIKKSGAGADDAKYPYLEKISFIKKFVNMRSSNAQSNVDISNEEGEASQSVFADNELNEQQIIHVSAGEESDSSQTTSCNSNIPSEAVKQEKQKQIQKKGTKRPYSRISQKDIDRVLDVKILDYLKSSDSKQETNVAEDGDLNFGQSVAAQLKTMNSMQNAQAKAKIQAILLEIQYPETNESPPQPLANTYNYPVGPEMPSPHYFFNNNR